MSRARDLADFKSENIVDTGTEGTKIATGTTAQRGSTAGQLRFNSTLGLAEYYTGTAFKAIDAPPTISSVDVTEIDSQAGGDQTLIISGSGFNSGAVVTFVGNAGTNFNATTTTVNSETQITAVAPKSSFLNAQEPYGVRITNTSGLSGILASQINVDTAPTWTTASGSLGTVYEDIAMSTITVAASDPDGDTIAYSVATGSLPTGLSLGVANGQITGTPNVNDTYASGGVTHSFTLRATANSKTSDRAFSILRKWKDGSTEALAVDHPDNLAALGISTDGTFWISGNNSQTGSAAQYSVAFNRGGRNWIYLNAAYFESLGFTTQSNSGVSNYGWATGNGRRYFRTTPNSTDYECWNNFDLGGFNFRYIAGTVGWVSMNGSTLGSGHPDNELYDDYRANDTDYNALGYNGEGSGNRSWHRFGIAGQFQLAYDELGFTSERASEVYPIYIGQKTSYFKSGVSRVNTGSNDTSYIDMGQHDTNRILRFSTGNESGAGNGPERYAWHPGQIYIS